MINKSYKSKSCNKSSSSSGSGNYIISNDGICRIIRIKDRDNFTKEIQKLNHPFTILDKELIEEFNLLKLEEGKEYRHSFDFSKMPNEKLFFLDTKDNIYEYYRKSKNSNNNVIFSSLITNKKKNEDLSLFNKIQSFHNKVERECKLYEFWIDYKIYLPFYLNEKFYKIIREERSHRFRYHLYEDDFENRIIMKFFGPRKTSKSIYMRCCLANYHVRHKKFFPTLILDVEFIHKNIINNKQKLKTVIYHELFNLFYEFDEVNEFFSKINFSINDTMKFIKNIIELYFIFFSNTNNNLNEMKNNNQINKVDNFTNNEMIIDNEYIQNEEYDIKMQKPLFCLDNYSYIYDNKSIIKDIENMTFNDSNFHLYIVYSINDKEDQKAYVDGCIKEQDFNLGFSKTPFPYCYLPGLRFLSEIKNELIKDNIIIPEKYEENFGENVYFLYKFLSKNISFEQFLKEETDIITKELEFFYYKVENKNYKITELINIIKDNCIIDFKREILESIPSNYIIINRTKKNASDDFQYSFNYSFPLVKKILQNLSEKIFFIDINHPDFDKLDDGTMSSNFYNFINFYFRNATSVFGFLENEIEKAYDYHCLEKNHIDENGNQVHKFEDIIEILDNNNNVEFLKLMEKYKNNKNILNGKKLIFVFQKFNGKFVDILLLVKNNNNSNYSVVNLQIKLSDTYSISRKDKLQETYQMTYLKIKYEYIFNIQIDKAYIIYLSLYECKKKFTENNPNIFIFYSRKINCIVDGKGKKIDKFPFLKQSRINLVSDLNMLIISLKELLENILCEKLLFKYTNQLNITNNYLKIEISEKNIKIFIVFHETKLQFLQTNDKNFQIQSLCYEISEDNTGKDEIYD